MSNTQPHPFDTSFPLIHFLLLLIYFFTFLFLTNRMSNILFTYSLQAWSAYPFTYSWTCIFTGATYRVTHIMVFRDRAIQLTITLKYSPVPQCSMDRVYGVSRHCEPHCCTETMEKIRFQEMRGHLIDFYRAPATFGRIAESKQDHVIPVSISPVTGRPG